ncbi:hypothetical protein FRC12_007073 [Ceratobasidium sp. 428]|nr:hypothetical protein FRC09_007313 [Ceratobasidium sp. 395]KAG8766125.1 hypothetical protein FRC12_007073 [Ceratobasidium sp. 428]
MVNPEQIPREIIFGIFKSYAQLSVKKFRREVGVDLPGSDTIAIPPIAVSGSSALQQLKFSEAGRAKAAPAPIKRVAIIGAGCSGLHAARLLQDNEIKVDIFEASDRTGGRLYTHKFMNGGQWDYFDVGAMRFPDTPLMRRTFELFDNLGITYKPYSISDGKNFMVYNGERKRKSQLASAAAWQEDPFRIFGALPEPWVRSDPSTLLHDAVQPYVDRLVVAQNIGDTNERERVLEIILDEIDSHSTRSYLLAVMHYPPKIINWIETMTVGTGWFDRSFCETVLEELAFRYGEPSPTDLDWYCVEGGSQTIIRRMEESMAELPFPVNIMTNHQVTAVELHKANPDSDNPTELYPYFTVSYLHKSSDPSKGLFEISPYKYAYSHVIFAIPPPCIRMIDISTCELDFAQRQALRELQLAPSSKVGIKFKTAWWKDPEVGITQGGQSTTDRVVRTIVYPSQGDFGSTVLIASYCWTQDSLAIGALMQDENSPAYARLKQVMLADLAFVHNYPLEKLEKQYDGMWPFDWTHNPLSMGAFGLFGPNQFKAVYPNLTRPAAEGQMYFIGETFSTIHGWVAGAIESADRAVFQMLATAQEEEQLIPPPPGAGSGVPTKGRKKDNSVQRFKEKWKPEFMVDETYTLDQVLLSVKLQQNEFNP